jgi:hypothetical protein
MEWACEEDFPMTTMEFVAAAFAPVNAQASAWRRLLDAIVAERRREADAYFAAYLRAHPELCD